MIGIKDAVVELTKGQMRFTEHSGADGAFSLSVPGGSYTLNVKAKGFCQYTRDLAVTENDAIETLSLALLDCSDCPNMSIDFAEPRIEPDVAPPKPFDPHNLVFKYQEETLRVGSSEEFKSVVLYGRRSDLGKFVEYTGLDCPGHEKLVVLQFNGGSLEAAKLRFSSEEHKIMGEGQVTVVDRRGINRGSIVEIDLLLDIPVAVITK
jgi:hypothetical protein